MPLIICFVSYSIFVDTSTGTIFDRLLSYCILFLSKVSRIDNFILVSGLGIFLSRSIGVLIFFDLQSRFKTRVNHRVRWGLNQVLMTFMIEHQWYFHIFFVFNLKIIWSSWYATYNRMHIIYCVWNSKIMLALFSHSIMISQRYLCISNIPMLIFREQRNTNGNGHHSFQWFLD